jgi:hypothetical protein
VSFLFAPAESPRSWFQRQGANRAREGAKRREFAGNDGKHHACGHSPETSANLGITRGWILSRLQAIAIAAEDAGKFGPANRALELLAKLRGDLIERTETNVKAVHVVISSVDVEDLTREPQPERLSLGTHFLSQRLSRCCAATTSRSLFPAQSRKRLVGLSGGSSAVVRPRSGWES